MVRFDNNRNHGRDSTIVEERISLKVKSACDGHFDTRIEMSVQQAVEADESPKRTCFERIYHVYSSFLLFLKRAFPFLFFVGYIVYVGFSIYLNPERALFICIITPLILYIILNNLTNGKLTRLVGKCFKATRKCVHTSRKTSVWVRRIITVAALVGILVFLVIDIWDTWEKWTPLGGLAVFIFITVLFSKQPNKINWTPVIWGIIIQFVLGLVILRWRPGFEACKWVGYQFTTFLGYTDKGSEFVFGEKYTDHPVVFQILPVVAFFSAVVSILYYIGVMQAIIQFIAILLQYALNTTPIESFATAAHIFIGQVESSLALKPFWLKLTESELHAVMTSGFATVAGTVIAAYIEFGVPAEHVISASFMSAPAALAIAKISIPETQTSQIKTQKEINLPSGKDTNVIEALSVGATSAVKLIAYVVANLIAFVSILAFFDAVISYLGSLVNYPELSFQVICSYVFMPLAAIMGVPWSEANSVGALIGKKIILNEFLAYIDLGAMIENGTLSERSTVLATYILCGFGSIAAIGINLGSLTSAEPEKRSDFAKLSLRSMINGNIACFMTACVAGLLYQIPSPDVAAISLNQTLSNNSSFVNTTQSAIL